VIDDVAKLLGGEAGVDGVQHSAAAGDRVVELKVPVTIPRNGGHTITGTNTEPCQRVGELERARPRVGIRVPARHPASSRRTCQYSTKRGVQRRTKHGARQRGRAATTCTCVF